ncbi:hypothetical protein [Parasphingopyxis marina]|uniref:Uncharacterized protein n=1 Tax=Parasphingopyxis marina TaxID=2761622 RepID=A0A842HXN0_9SPHN|nr:hypothetical protein [Parasphingopyxis marina]MBC2777635.1 hypothetical protein [Parasphingopyxis marina]
MRFAAAPLLFVSIAALAACSGEAQSDASAVPDETAVEPAAEANLLVLDPTVGEGGTPVDSAGVNEIFDPECVITEDGVANLGMPATLGEFVEAFPARTVLTFYPSYMVDFGALCARSDGEDAICAIFENYEIESYAGGIGISAFSVQSDVCRTAEGVGPGSPIADAVAAYGPATFGFNYDNEGREYVRFENEPAGYAFRAESATGEALEGDIVRAPGRHGGDYAGVSGDGSYFETDRAQPDATLWEIWINSR